LVVVKVVHGQHLRKSVVQVVVVVAVVLTEMVVTNLQVLDNKHHLLDLLDMEIQVVLVIAVVQVVVAVVQVPLELQDHLLVVQVESVEPMTLLAHQPIILAVAVDQCLLVLVKQVVVDKVVVGQDQLV
jgi:hypothetical protein